MKIAKKDREKWQADKIKQLQAENGKLKRNISKLEKSIGTVAVSAIEPQTEPHTTEADTVALPMELDNANKEIAKWRNEYQEAYKLIDQLHRQVEMAKHGDVVFGNFNRLLTRHNILYRNYRKIKRQFQKMLNNEIVKTKDEIAGTTYLKFLSLLDYKPTKEDAERLQSFKNGEMFYPSVGIRHPLFWTDLIIYINPRNGRQLFKEEMDAIRHQLKDDCWYREAMESFRAFMEQNPKDEKRIAEYAYSLGIKLIPLYEKMII